MVTLGTKVPTRAIAVHGSIPEKNKKKTKKKQTKGKDVRERFKMFIRKRMKKMMLKEGNKEMGVKKLLLVLQENM